MGRRNTRAGKARRRAERQQLRERAGQAAALAAGITVAEDVPGSPAGGTPQELSGFPGREPPARPQPRHRRVLGVQLSRFWFPENGENDVTWSAEWGLRDDLVGIEDSNEDLQQLVDDIVEDARRWADRDSLAIEWELSGDASDGKTVQDMVAEAGVTLPVTLNPA